MNTVSIRELRLKAWIGLYRHEKIAPQTIAIDLEIDLPTDRVFRTGKVADTVDYGVVVRRVKELLAEERFGLVETLAERIASLISEDFHSPRVKVSIAKLGVLPEAKYVGVVVERRGG